MKYVFDTSPLSVLFRSYYRSRFPSLWDRFNSLVDFGFVTSTAEVHRELKDASFYSAVLRWSKKHRMFFTKPTRKEAEFVRGIFQVRRFQNIIERKKLLNGGKNADPFVIAKAYAINGKVVTLEKKTKTGTKIPDICGHFDIECILLEQFMEEQQWTF